MHNWVLIACVCLLFSACSGPAASFKTSSSNLQKKLTIAQGVYGFVVFKEGYFDTDNHLQSEGIERGVERKIYIYPRINIHAVDLSEGDYLNNIYVPCIDSVNSDESGFFQKKMLPGKYSLVIIENNRYYSKLDENGEYFPVEILKDSVTQVLLDVDYKAIYE